MPSVEEEPNFQVLASTSRPAVKSLYESFVSGGNLDEDDPKHFERDPEKEGPAPERPRQGNTLYVHAIGASEDLLRAAFTPFGSILNITMEMAKK